MSSCICETAVKTFMFVCLFVCLFVTLHSYSGENATLQQYYSLSMYYSQPNRGQLGHHCGIWTFSIQCTKTFLSPCHLPTYQIADQSSWITLAFLCKTQPILCEWNVVCDASFSLTQITPLCWWQTVIVGGISRVVLLIHPLISQQLLVRSWKVSLWMYVFNFCLRSREHCVWSLSLAALNKFTATRWHSLKWGKSSRGLIRVLRPWINDDKGVT